MSERPGYGEKHGEEHYDDAEAEKANEEFENGDDVEPLTQAAAEDDDHEKSGIDWKRIEMVTANWLKVWEDIYELDSYIKKEKYFSYGTNLTDAIMKAIIGFNYACPHCLF